VTSPAFRRVLPAALAGALLLGAGATGPASASTASPADLPPSWGPQFSLITQPDAGHAELYAMIASAHVIISDWPTMWTVLRTDESDFLGGTPWTVTATS
jgi:hypothetical protein